MTVLDCGQKSCVEIAYKNTSYGTFYFFLSVSSVGHDIVGHFIGCFLVRTNRGINIALTGVNILSSQGLLKPSQLVSSPSTYELNESITPSNFSGSIISCI